MLGKKTEWLIRISGSALLFLAFYKLYTRPLTHSYHEAFLFLHLQLVLWLMLLLIMALVSSSFSKRKNQWAIIILSFLLLAPYPFFHQRFTAQAEQHFFQQRYTYFEQINRQTLDKTTAADEEKLYNQLASIDVRSYEKGENYVAYWVDRMPEQRNGFIFLLEGQIPDKLFGYPVKQTKHIGKNWFSFSSE
ncbi:putative membrane-bound spermidine synthase [Catalinimonas alkaloidigena]|uniref:hypothetical protein n=1 Tax=Catalinimonas alkaloidigena TaxID=1075417 RepID=UPI0024065B2B|nr:hypothetical protein [Catalinimonas alkaloidigena]MDF9799520.1 putative membrane-bound spermidine synthase [Catalinimonas alkaloidigena]